MGHYFDEEPTAPSMPRDVELWLPDMTLTLTTDRGVFGYGQIDAGSKLLLLKAANLRPTGNSARPRMRRRHHRAAAGSASTGGDRVGSRRQRPRP